MAPREANQLRGLRYTVSMRMKYVALLRGVNVGGKNKLSMTDLKVCFENLGFTEVSTLLNSGNVVFTANDTAQSIARKIEASLIQTFKFDGQLIKVLVLSKNDINKVINQAPQGFGSEPDTYHTDVVFLINVPAEAAFAETECHPEVDVAWKGNGVIYYQRLSEKRTQSRLSKIISKPVYKSMTIRTWGTVQKLSERMKASG